MKPFVVLITACALTVAACSNPSPVVPSSPSAAGAEVSAKPSAAAGTYSLSFLARVNGVVQEVTSLPVSSAELILRAYVAGSDGVPAQAGTVTFEYCSYKGRPPNDITRADEAPKEACDAGTAAWARLMSLAVYPGHCPPLGAGYACMNFGIVRIPRDVGFRFRYSSQGSSVASGTSDARNFTWTAGS
jgi:hypothetical protein